jgi:cell division inhibitor SepF
MEVCILKPIDADSAEEVCDAIIAGKAVMVNFANVNDYDRQRIIDMASGTTYAVEGRLKLVNDMIAIFAPRDIEITGDLEEYASSSIRVPSLGYQDFDDEEE